MTRHISILLYFLLILSESISFSIPNDTQCYCGYQQSENMQILRCASKKADVPSPAYTPIFCHRSGGTIRIGDSNMAASSDSPIFSIEPDGLSRLQEGGRVSMLQLNVPLQARPLDALVFTGLPDLKVLHAWRLPISLEPCSLAVLSSLENAVIDCQSNFDRFLTFSRALKSVRLTGCQGRSLQFICTRCSQDPEVSVLRVFPGPPMIGKNYGFTKDSSSNLTLPTCHLGICSENHLCRNNAPLKLALNRSLPRTIPNTSTTPIPSPSFQTTSAPEIVISSSQSQNRQLYLTVFLVLFLLLFIISWILCIIICLRISRAIKRKRVNQSPLDVRVMNSSSWSSSTPLNEPKAH